LTPHAFIQKWQAAQLSERSACQQHFLDLCDLLGQPKPAAADPEGTWYTFERGVRKTNLDEEDPDATASGEPEASAPGAIEVVRGSPDPAPTARGWADVWLRDHFGWEYKGKHKDLAAAYKQLLQYREDLQNPPLLIVCDLDRFEIHTNFTGTVKKVYKFSLAELAEPENLDILRRVFTDPQSLKPGQTAEAVTAQAAELIGQIADGMRQRGIPAHDAAHFLMKLMFSMFAEDIGLLKNKAFKQIIDAAAKPGAVNAVKKLSQLLGQLFEAMAHGGNFGADDVLHFNGGLFADAKVYDLTLKEIDTLKFVNELDWSSVEPSVFGTLFERILDPDKRSQIGAHYTGRADIETLLQPVVMQPLRREWDAVKAECDALWVKVQETSRKEAAKGGRRRSLSPKQSPAGKKLEKLLRDFTHRLEDVTILDPACGSGNFLYVSLNLLLDLNKEVISYAAQKGVTVLPSVRPTQLLGIEINEYAQELASVVIWIGYLQWMHDNGFTPHLDPVLEPFESIHRMDAILDLSDPENPREPEWPAAEFIVGNPPFLGGKLMRTHLGNEYMEALFKVWDESVRSEADLCCYWFEKARDQIVHKKTKRAGLLATQGIRGGANRQTLKRIKESGDIFFAVSDRQWILDGANVHISMIAFDCADEQCRTLDGNAVPTINANLSSTADITHAKRLSENADLSFMGDTKGGAFDISQTKAIEFLQTPNPHQLPNSNIITPWTNGLDVTKRSREMWIVDFGTEMPESEAASYERPFEFLREHVFPERQKNRRDSYRQRWWLHVEPRGGMRRAFDRSSRYLATTTVSKHRLFVWMSTPTLPDHQLIVFARSDDYFFGVLHSRVHEIWGLKLGTRLETRPRYTPTTCFETFPFPEPTDTQREAIAAAAKELDTLRNNWLNPPEWTRTEVLEFPGSTTGPWRRYIDPATVQNDPRQSRGLSGATVRDANPTTTSAPGSAGGSPASSPQSPASSAIGTVRNPALSPTTKSAQNSSRNAPSPTSTTNAPPGSTSPTKNSTPPSSPPTAGTPASPTTTSSPNFWPSISNAPPTSKISKSLSQNGRGLSQICGVFGANWDCPPLQDCFGIGSMSFCRWAPLAPPVLSTIEGLPEIPHSQRFNALGRASLRAFVVFRFPTPHFCRWPKKVVDFSRRTAKSQGEGVRSMFSANDERVIAMPAGRKMDQTPTLQFSC